MERYITSISKTIKSAHRAKDYALIDQIEAGLMDLQDQLDEIRIKQQDRINHRYDFPKN